MDESDDEESVPQYVEEYYFVDEKESPISFSILPIYFEDDENRNVAKEKVFLHGTVDKGLQKIFKQVIAWKLVLVGDQPEISVLSKDNKWIKLVKPRKSYEDVIRTVLITIQMLHFLKNKPEASEKSLWEHLLKVFMTFEVLPSEDDFKDTLPLINIYYDKDETLAKSQVLLSCLQGKLRGKAFINEIDKRNVDRKQSFFVFDDEADDVTYDNDGEDSDEDSDLFDSVCAICDNGGELLCCEGRCMRSFHATKDAGTESLCKTLGLTKGQVERIQNFLCANCLYKQHQCFACGKLGSSDKSAGAEVFPCVNATCGHFYHPKCVAGLLFPGNEVGALELQKKIKDGETFTCPVHKCIVCKQGENKEVLDLQFAVCRRCPTSYHRKCLPRRVAFEELEEEGIIQRAWEDLLPNRILIYCLKHEIDEDLGTPIRNHIIFPEGPEKKVTAVEKSSGKIFVKKKARVFDASTNNQSSVKPTSSVKHPTVSEKNCLGKRARDITDHAIQHQKKVQPKDNAQSIGKQFSKVQVNQTMKEKLKAPVPYVSPTSTRKELTGFKSSYPEVDDDATKRVNSLMEKVSSDISLKDIMKKHTMPSTHSYSAKHIEKSIQHGKIEGAVEAIHTALNKLEDGGNVDDAKAVCEPEVLKQINKWGNKLKIYLAPFLHGMRYTSFGRHFTKVDKLEEIADKLKWYVHNGDMIVDFCCGANDFSQVMKAKLDALGKKCLFKNYDVIRPKNTFNFERRDWMKVQPRELPTGSQLIMGLNPPFGVKAALANKFIDKALTFRPKLLILIVPQETERLDRKSPAYDLIWEDRHFLSGKSFYLPGSVDVNDKQMEQWNVKPPVLYLWSRSDWSAKNKSIAMKYSHIPSECSYLIHGTHEDMLVDAVSSCALLQEEGGRERSKSLEHWNNKKSQEEIERMRETDKDSTGLFHTRSGENGKGGLQNIKKIKKQKESPWASKVHDSSDMEISDMDVSPPRKAELGNQNKDHRQSKPLEMPSERTANHVSECTPAFQDAARNTLVHDNIDEIARRYCPNGGALSQPCSNLAWQDNRQNLDVQFSGYSRESIGDPYTRLYANDYGGYGVQPGTYGLQGKDDCVQGNGFLLEGLDLPHALRNVHSSASYRLSGPATGPSAAQRYAPRLDETNFSRAGDFGSRGSVPGMNNAVHGIPSPVQRDVHFDSKGFVLGSQSQFPDQGSSGWLDD